jgi:type II secretory pathway component PulF
LSIKDVREQLLAKGLYAREVRSVSGGPRNRRFSVAVRSVFYRELGALLNAGLPLDRSLELLSEHPELGGGDDILPLVRDLVREGQDLSKCLETHLPGMREDEAAVVAAGERAGNLAKVVGELADYLDEEAQIREQLRTALVYPAVIAVLAVIVLGVLVGFLLPVYETLLEGLGQELPLLTTLILQVGKGLRHPIGLGVLLAVMVLVTAGIRKLRRNPDAVFPESRYRIPVLGATLAALARARFARPLALLMDGGVALPEAIRVAGRATGSRWLSECSNQASDQVTQGMRVTDAVMRLPVLQVDLPGWIRAGEASGDLAGLLRHAALSHQRAWNRGLARSLSLVEPLLIISVGLFILLVALAILLPMLRVNQSLGF